MNSTVHITNIEDGISRKETWQQSFFPDWLVVDTLDGMCLKELRIFFV